MRVSTGGLALVASLSMGLAGGGALAKSDFAKIVPGPGVQSEEERAIQADPDAGVEDAVVLADETEYIERPGINSDLTYHLRVKILSAKERDFANIEITHDMPTGSGLYSWWGRTIKPDGTVLELKQEDLKSVSIAKKGTRNTRS